MDYLFFWSTVIVCVLILVFAYVRKKIDFSALFASGLVGTIIIISLGDLWYWIYIVLAFFIVGNLVSKYRFSEKEKNGVDQDTRTFRNVFGNGGSAVFFSMIYYITGDSLYLFGFLGSMAAATADTFATEIGQIYEKKPRLITNLRKRVKVGTSGAVSIPGSLAAILGAFLVSLFPVFFNQGVIYLGVGVLAGFIGCNFDSLLGASFERKILDKHLVNLFGTFSGGLFAVLLAFILT